MRAEVPALQLRSVKDKGECQPLASEGLSIKVGSGPSLQGAIETAGVRESLTRPGGIALVFIL